MSSERFRVVLVDYDEDLFTPPQGIAEELAAAGLGYTAGQWRTEGEALQAARDADVVLVQSTKPLMTAKTIQQLERCRCIVRLGIGYDSVDIEAATQRGILVCNAPTYCVDDVADHALALLLDGVRHIARQDRMIRAGLWDRTGARPARRLKGCTLGFVAFGRIARALAQRVSGFGLNLVAFDPYVDEAAMARCGVTKVSLDDLLRQADLISIHSPLTAETRHLISTREFGLMKDGAFLVNTSRGPLIDQAALVDALRAGKLCGVGLDVMETEPLPLDSPLRAFDNVTFTPHVGANSEESVADLYRIGVRIAVDVSQGVWPEAVVNPRAEAASDLAWKHR
ncbi:MAG: C-terminal binding protein [Anaerolineae bacterium]